MVIITGQVPTHAIGLDAFKKCDTVATVLTYRQAQFFGQRRGETWPTS
jgi:thiamine pyrophosphate-dependent acetolactate synthase large subunit-like protein